MAGIDVRRMVQGFRKGTRNNNRLYYKLSQKHGNKNSSQDRRVAALFEIWRLERAYEVHKETINRYKEFLTALEKSD